jgi:hypothetical protein
VYLVWSLLSLPLLIGFAIVFSPGLPHAAAGEDEDEETSTGNVLIEAITLMPNLVSSCLVPSAIGFLVSLSILGIALFPWLAGVLAQGVGIWSLLPYTVMLTTLMLVSWWVIFRSSAIRSR